MNGAAAAGGGLDCADVSDSHQNRCGGDGNGMHFSVSLGSLSLMSPTWPTCLNQLFLHSWERDARWEHSTAPSI